MIDRLVFIQRKKGLSIEAFRHHWREVHGPIAARIPGLRSYIQYDLANSANGDIRYPKGPLVVDGVGLLTFDDMRSIETGFGPKIVPALVADEEKFIGGLDLLTTVPRVVIPMASDAPTVRRISLVKRRANVDANTFQTEWWSACSEGVRTMPGVQGFIRRLVIDHGVGQRESPHYAEPPVDGVEELCFLDMHSLRAALASQAAEAMAAEAGAFIGETTTFLVEAHRIV